MSYLLLPAGLLLLSLGSQALVSGAVTIARRLNISPMVIGLTLVGFGTSTPELAASAGAALMDAPGIALGNVVGSNIANILLIVGVTALIAPLAVQSRALRRDGAVMLAATLTALALTQFPVIGRLSGLAMLAGLAMYLGHVIRSDRQATVYAAEAEAIPVVTGRLPPALALVGAGFAGLILGAHWLVESAIALARQWGAPESLIGLTVVALGTSLPELATSVAAALKRESDVALGNIIGSNIFNILGILGVTAALRPVPVASDIAGEDIWVMLAATLALLLFAATGWRIKRWEGLALLTGYAGYIAWRV